MKSIHEYASIYVEEFNLSVTPVKGKIPLLPGWQKIHGSSILAERYEDTWAGATGLGLLCGEPSGIICLDIDITDGDDRLIALREEFLSKMPPMYLGRIGNPRKPPALFFKYNGEKNRKWNNIKIEILSTGNQVLLPPSLHPDTGTRYKWADRRLSQVDYDEMPDLPEWIFEWNEHKNGLYKPKKKLNGTVAGAVDGTSSGNPGGVKPASGRCNHNSHNNISAFAVAKYRAGRSFDDLVSAVMAYDKTINSDADYLYFNCPSRKWRSTNALNNAKWFVRQIFDNPERQGEHGIDKTNKSDSSNPNYWIVGEDGKKKASGNIDDYKDLFSRLYDTARKDYFSGVVFYKSGHEWKPIENEIRVIRSKARRFGLMHSHVEDSLHEWFSELKPRLLIDIPKWDGEDHIGELLSFVKVKNVSHDDFESLFKAWLAGIFKRVYHPEFHNQCVIFKGAQGIGKDMFFGNLFKALNGYYSEVNLVARQKDNYESIEPLMVSYLPEFDESSRIPISTIKAFISASKATFRGAYDRKASAHTFRHSVVSSANFDNILRDPTGNRRFWIFEIESIDWAYNEVINSAQCIAQAFALYKDSYVARPGALEKMKEYIKDQTPVSSEDLFIEEVRALLEERYRNFYDVKTGQICASKKLTDSDKVRWHHIASDMVAMARKYGFATRNLQSILKRKGFSKPDMKSTYYLPPEMVKVQP